MFFTKEISKECQTFARKSKFLGTKIWRNALALKSNMVQGKHLGKSFFWDCFLHLSFIHKTVSQISFSFFCTGDKRVLSEFLRKWGWF